MSYQFNIDPKRRASARFIASVRSELAQAIAEARARGLSQQALAERVGVNKSVITRLLTGEGNLTLRSLAEVAWGLDKIATFRLRDPKTAGNLANVATATAELTSLIQKRSKTDSALTIASTNYGSNKLFADAEL